MVSKIIWITTIVILSATIGAFAGSEKELTQSSLKALGAPNNPKVEVVWNRYYDHKELGEICERIAKAYPKLVKFTSIGNRTKVVTCGS